VSHRTKSNRESPREYWHHTLGGGHPIEKIPLPSVGSGIQKPTKGFRACHLATSARNLLEVAGIDADTHAATDRRPNVPPSAAFGGSPAPAALPHDRPKRAKPTPDARPARPESAPHVPVGVVLGRLTRPAAPRTPPGRAAWVGLVGSPGSGLSRRPETGLHPRPSMRPGPPIDPPLAVCGAVWHPRGASDRLQTSSKHGSNAIAPPINPRRTWAGYPLFPGFWPHPATGDAPPLF